MPLFPAVRNIPVATSTLTTSAATAQQALLRTEAIPAGATALVDITVIGLSTPTAIRGTASATTSSFIVGAGTQFQTDANTYNRLNVGDEVLINGGYYKIVAVTSNNDAQLDRVATFAGQIIYKVYQTVYRTSMHVQRYDSTGYGFPGYRAEAKYETSVSTTLGKAYFDEAGTVDYSFSGDGSVVVQVSPRVNVTKWTGYASVYYGTRP
jgi:hypothetical protein